MKTVLFAALVALTMSASAQVATQASPEADEAAQKIAEKCANSPEGFCYVLTHAELKAALQAAYRAGRLFEQQQQKTVEDAGSLASTPRDI